MIVRFAKRLRDRRLTLRRFFRAVSWVPVPIVVLFLVPMGWWFAHGDVAAAIFTTLVCGLSLGTTFTLKYILRRHRPRDVVTALGRLDSSFPSGHTAGSFAAACALAYLAPSLAAAALTFALVVAVSRLYLGLHYLSDVTGGMLVAYGFTLFVIHSDVISFLTSLAFDVVRV